MAANDSVKLERILVPVDFSEASDEQVAAGQALTVGAHHVDVAPASRRALQLAAAVARGAGPNARLCLLHATPALDVSTMYTGPAGVTLPPKVVHELHEKAEATSTGVLEALAARYAEGIRTEHVARSGRALDVILEQAQAFHADLIVMAASGRSRVARFFVGSTADRIIRRAACPVTVVPAGG